MKNITKKESEISVKRYILHCCLCLSKTKGMGDYYEKAIDVNANANGNGVSLRLSRR